MKVQPSKETRDEIRNELDSYVEKLRLADVEDKTERWFPPHHDGVTDSAREFHDRMLNVWRG